MENQTILTDNVCVRAACFLADPGSTFAQNQQYLTARSIAGKYSNKVISLRSSYQATHFLHLGFFQLFSRASPRFPQVRKSESSNSSKVSISRSSRLRPATLLKKRLCHRCFPVNFVKFLRTPFFTEHLWWLLLHWINSLFPSRTINRLLYPRIILLSSFHLKQIGYWSWM